MKKALIVYQSVKGHTKLYGENIGNCLKQLDCDSTVVSIDEFKKEQLEGVTHVLLGCWTSGLFLFLQHPDKPWRIFMNQFTLPAGVKTCLFTTYKLATGSMFKVMMKQIPSQNAVHLHMKSKTGNLSEADKAALAGFIKD